ncbi:globin [Bacillaceae bacterium SIJ1]|uniref:globin domain-containing protein n=1 Tax=Litoribacterium kuwaitense TaxID=1398745 RepID=UPI0013EB24E0|nr:globin [Litoribacterium kuwaitense]NGP44582.1 globin [Litoribacterium kuwaitense]
MSPFEQTAFEKLGGHQFLKELVEKFYQLVGNHPDLAPLFPEDFTETKRKQAQFLTQFLGGPSLYTDEHGHPRLRARHLPFPITPHRAEAWLQCMRQALEETPGDIAEKQHLFERLTLTAHHMINTPQDGS